MLHCASQVSHGLVRDIPGVTAVSGQRISAWGLQELNCRRWFKCKFDSNLAKTYHVSVTNLIHLNVWGQWWLFLWTTRLNNNIWEKCCVLQHSSSWNDYYCWLIGQIPSYVSVHLIIKSVYLVIHIFHKISTHHHITYPQISLHQYNIMELTHSRPYLALLVFINQKVWRLWST